MSHTSDKVTGLLCVAQRCTFLLLVITKYHGKHEVLLLDKKDFGTPVDFSTAFYANIIIGKLC